MSFRVQAVGQSDEWYTPEHVFKALDCRFDIDVASPGQHITPWIPARRFITSGSLESEWSGFVWMNPPFGPRNGIVPWLEKFVAHGNGICLTPDRTSAPWWQQFAREMDTVLFVAPKIKFIGPDGTAGKSPAQGTSLMGIGLPAWCALYSAEKNGLGRRLQPLRETPACTS